jgi:hypothetical protein
MPRFRFTIRQMMIAVAIVSTAIGGEMMRRRWASCRDDARRCTSIERIALKGVAASLRDAESYKSRANRERAGAGVFVQSGPVEHEDDLRWCNEHALLHSRLLCTRLKQERDAQWLDSRADFRTLQATIFQDQAESFGRLARRHYARAAEVEGDGINLMRLLGALMIVWASGVYFVKFFKSKRLRDLAAALVTLPVAILHA